MQGYRTLTNTGLTHDFSEISKFIKDKDIFINSNWLITGATGMMGSYLLSFLNWLNEEELNSSMKITAIHRNEIRKTHSPVSHLIGKKFIKFRKIDLSKKFVFKDEDNFDFVFHGASNAVPKIYLKHPIETINTNVAATQILLEHLVKRRKPRVFLYVSSGEIYGSPETENIPTPEKYIGITNHLSPRACYVEAKKFGETLCWNYFRYFNLPVKIIRPVHVFGPGFKENDSRVWADFIIKASHGQDIEIQGDGSSRRGFCYLADALTQIFAVIQKGKSGEVYNIGNDKHISIKELANIIAKKSENNVKVIIKNKLPGYLQGSPQISCPSISKVKSLSPLLNTELHEGIEKTINWYNHYRKHKH